MLSHFLSSPIGLVPMQQVNVNPVAPITVSSQLAPFLIGAVAYGFLRWLNKRIDAEIRADDLAAIAVIEIFFFAPFAATPIGGSIAEGFQRLFGLLLGRLGATAVTVAGLSITTTAAVFFGFILFRRLSDQQKQAQYARTGRDWNALGTVARSNAWILFFLFVFSVPLLAQPFFADIVNGTLGFVGPALGGFFFTDIPDFVFTATPFS